MIQIFKNLPASCKIPDLPINDQGLDGGRDDGEESNNMDKFTGKTYQTLIKHIKR